MNETVKARIDVLNAVADAVEEGMSAETMRRIIIDGIQTVFSDDEACKYIDCVLTPHK